MNQPTTEQLAKLPKWAREYIEDTENRLNIALSTLDKMLDNQTDSKVYYIKDAPRTGGCGFAKIYVQSETIKFKIGHELIECEIEEGGCALRVHGLSSRIRIAPNAANSITIHPI